MLRQLRREDYTVGWVCALSIELAAAKALLDEKHESPTHDLNDDNVYCTGSIAGHNVVIVCLPAGRIGNNPAAAVATHMRMAFRNIRFGLMVGIGGGVPSTRKDIRLGDVVVSEPYNTFSGVVQYDMGKIKEDGYERTGSLAAPPSILLSAIQTIKANQKLDESQLPTYLAQLERFAIFQRSKAGPDILFEANYHHEGDNNSCQACDINQQVDRNQRERGQEVEVHYGTIASGNAVMRSASERDKTSKALDDVICFEMEAAGLMNTFPCLVIRGICDYADSHKNKRWQPYAAGAAAAYAKEVLSVSPIISVSKALSLQEENIERPSSKRRRTETTYVPEDESAVMSAEKQEEQQKQEQQQKQERERERKEKQRILLESLAFESLYARQTNIRNAHFRTCKWLLHTQQYIDWADHKKWNEHHGLLWIKGKPGAGKSTMMKYISKNIKKTMEDWTVISFFFNARGKAIEGTTEGAYRSLLTQLFHHFPALQSKLLSSDVAAPGSIKELRWNTESLKSLLEDTILGLNDSPIVLLIDALDECEEEEIRDMVSLFERLGELAIISNICLRVCFSSRFYPHITIDNGLDLILDQEDQHKHDIAIYLQSELRIGKSELAEQVRDEVQRKASGVFMWVVLVTRILNKEYDRGKMSALTERLKEIPQDLHDLFRDIIHRDSYLEDELALCIQWVLFARQPLSPEELCIAISSGMDIDEVLPWNQEIMTPDVIERLILNYSKGLVEITKTTARKVQFIHESVRDFLLKGNEFGNIWPSLRQNFEGKSHDRLKECCLRYLTSTWKQSTEEPNDRLNMLKTPLENAPFLGYATNNIMYHANGAQGFGIPQHLFLNNFQVSRWILLLNTFGEQQYPKLSQNASLVYILAQHGMADLIRAAKPGNLSFKIEDEAYGCPLLAAMAGYSRNTAEALLESCVTDQFDTAIRSKFRKSGFFHLTGFKKFSNKIGLFGYLVKTNFKAAITVLMNSEIFDPNGWNDNKETPLSLAVKARRKSIIKLLLNKKDIDINVEDIWGHTPFSWAIHRDDIKIARILLDTGKVDIDNDNMHKGVLSSIIGTKSGVSAGLKLLLETEKMTYDAKTRLRNTALTLAADAGNREVIQLILGDDDLGINAKAFEGCTALLAATIHSNWDAFFLLLAKDVGVNASNEAGHTALSVAAIMGKWDIVKLLLDKGVDHNTYNPNEDTPLCLAALEGQYEIVKQLLDQGVDINSKDRLGNTALSLAVFREHTNIVRLLLLEDKVEVDTVNKIGQTPLHVAVSTKNQLSARLLLETWKVNIHKTDRWGRTPLYQAQSVGGEMYALFQSFDKSS